MIIDSHTHVGDKSHTARDLLSSMDEAGIDYAMLIADSAPLEDGMNIDQVVKICEENPRLKAIGDVEYKTLDDSQIQKLVSYFKENKIHGVKLYPGYEDFYPLDEKLFAFYEWCQKLGKSVIFHKGMLQIGLAGRLKQSHPLNIDDLANRFPELKIIMAHFGNPWVVDAAAVALKNKNVYVDVSGYFAVGAPIPQKAVDFFVEDLTYFKNFVGDFKKCLFGTDWPLYSQKEYLDAVRQLPFTEEEKELVFWKNAKEIFGLEA